MSSIGKNPVIDIIKNELIEKKNKIINIDNGKQLDDNDKQTDSSNFNNFIYILLYSICNPPLNTIRLIVHSESCYNTIYHLAARYFWNLD
ncbi:unnamed protein product [Schistosoma rodhaini]|uniref:Uncharacterized protein n=1 Tax=Schistosoma rodhaini TaxID=6188 RepID=A0AA85F338_9TREM|nr:unnamed protein product [Schistosoma rodhaini]